MNYARTIIPIKSNHHSRADRDERGAATLIAVLVLALVSVFVALALSRVTTEAIVMNNDSLNTRTYYAAHASLELMTRNFSKLFNSTVTPSTADITTYVINKNPANFGGKIDPGGGPLVSFDDFQDYDFNQQIFSTGAALTNQPIGGGDFAGLAAERTPYKMITTATHKKTGAQVTLERNFISNVIPIFQFGIFYDHDLEFYAGRNFNFGGLVHTNADLYLLGGSYSSDYATTFQNPVTALGHIVHDVARNGEPWTALAGSGLQDNVKIYDRASIAVAQPFNHGGSPGHLAAAPANMGSVIGGPDTDGSDPDRPDGTSVAGWETSVAAIFQGNLKRVTKALRVPVGGGAAQNIELIKRERRGYDASSADAEYEVNALGRPGDQKYAGLSTARYFNKPGLRITLADTKAKLPGCYDKSQLDKAVTVQCGIRLDGSGNGLGADNGSRTNATDGSRGYQPLPLVGGSPVYQAQRINGYRLYTGPSYDTTTRQTWIKVERVPEDTPTPEDITEEILSLGLTDLNPNGLVTPTGTRIGDANAIIKLQRYEIPGDASLNTSPVTIETPKVRILEPNGVNLSSMPGGLSSPFSAKWTGSFQAPTATGGSFTFNLRTNPNDGVRLYIWDPTVTSSPSPILNVWNGNGLQDHPVSISLTANKFYNIEVDYFLNGAAIPTARLDWSYLDGGGTLVSESPMPGGKFKTPDDAGVDVFNRLKAEYFTDSVVANVKNFVPRPASTYSASAGLSYVDVNSSYTRAILDAATSETDTQSSVTVQIGAGTTKVVPVPIEMFDTREGLFSVDYDTTLYGSSIPFNGVMSMVDVDVANLNRLLNGDFDANFPAGTPYALAHGGTFRVLDGGYPNGTRIPNLRGRVVYVSDRRGDRDFDGEFDMEDIYRPLSGTIDDPTSTTPLKGEDANGNNYLDTDFAWEASKYVNGAVGAIKYDNATKPPFTSDNFSTANADIAAVFDHRYFRRGVRLINGRTLFGTTTAGLTVASENGVYIKGDYNAQSVASHGEPTPSRDFCPSAETGSGCTGGFAGQQVPASVVGDAVTVLSNNWKDGNSFSYPFSVGAGTPYRLATETTVRAAMIAGDTISSQYFDSGGSPLGGPTQGGGILQKLNGGVHNYLRMLEWWKDGVYFNYAGSLIALYHSRNNTGSFKFGSPYQIYRAPSRNWTFDDSFKDPTFLPPQTPAVQHSQTTGFRVVTE